MFNTTIHKTEVTPVTRVVEKTITPDKVTEMYDKVKTEVLSSILASYRITNSLFEAVLLVRQDTQTLSTMLDCTFTINGDKYQRSLVLNDKEKFSSKTYLYDKICRTYADELTNILLRTAHDLHKL